MKQKKKYLIGDVFKNYADLEFEVVGYSDKTNYRIVKFSRTGFENDVQINHIRTGKVRDYMNVDFYGVGYIGKSTKCNNILYGRWKNMLSRCYNEKDSNYRNYGAKGVIVDKSWFNYAQYENDILNKLNCDELIKNPKLWSIDKDILSNGRMIYSNDTTMIITKSDNSKEQIARIGSPSKYNKVMVDKLSMGGEYICTYDYIKLAGKMCGVHYQSICAVCKGKRISAGGYKWRYSNGEKGDM